MDAAQMLNLGTRSTIERWLRPSGLKSDAVIPASVRLSKLNDHVFEVCKPAGGGRPSLEIVFFHGLQLERSSQPHVTTWLSEDKSELWLKWLQDDYPNIRILIVSYDASSKATEKEGRTDMYVTSENLVHDLTGRAAHVGQYGCPVILVGHSLGGLVLTEVCVTANSNLSSKDPVRDPQVENLRNFLENVKGVFFYATPHHRALILPGLSASSSSSSSSREGLLLKELAPLNEQAQRRNEDFRKLRLKWKWKAAAVGEGREVSTENYEGFVVSIPEASSISHVDGMKYRTIIAAADHFDISHATDKDSACFAQLSKFIDDILQECRLSIAPQPVGPKSIVGMHEVVEKNIERLKSTKRLGIIGMGGIGKTTLAKSLYERIKGRFQYACFVDDVNGRMGAKKDLGHLQKLITERLVEEGVHKVDGGFDWQRLRGKKILIILDDVEKWWHVEMMGKEDEFSGESRMIVTSRDRSFLYATGFDFHEMELLSDSDSYKLFCPHAFRKDKAPNYLQDHVQKVLQKCGNLPLAIEVVGEQLYGQELAVWPKMLERITGAHSLDGSDPDDLWLVLRTSVDFLTLPEREMFLDIATCFHGMDIEDVKLAWKFMKQRSAETGWQNLVVRCLAKHHHGISMHELLRDLGKSIARIGQVGNSPIHTRVDDSRIANKLRSEEMSRVQVLKLVDSDDYSDYRRNDREHLDMRKLHHFHDLRALWLDEGGKCVLTEDCIFPVQLTYVQIFRAGSVAMEGICRIQGLRCLILKKGVKELPPSLGDLVHLEHLELCDCDIKVIPREISHLRSLQHLGIYWCKKLTIISEKIGQLQDLHHFEIKGCDSLDSLPSSITLLGTLKVLKIGCCNSLVELPEWLGHLPGLEQLEIEQCNALLALPESYERLGSLKALKIRYCSSLVELPKLLGQFRGLEQLEIEQCNALLALPESLGLSISLKALKIRYCSSLVELPESLGQLHGLEQLEIEQCNALLALPKPWQLISLKVLKIRWCHSLIELPMSLGQLTDLEQLEIEQCDALLVLPEYDRQLIFLKVLKIRCCNSLVELPESLGQLSGLEQLEIEQCDALLALPKSCGQLISLKVLKIGYCDALVELPESLGQLSGLEQLEIEQCNALLALPKSCEQLISLKGLKISVCRKLVELPKSFRLIRGLRCLTIEHCWNLRELPESIAQLGLLKRVAIKKCPRIRNLGNRVGCFGALEELEVDRDILAKLAVYFGQFASLKLLIIECLSNEQGELPDSLGQLGSLEELVIRNQKKGQMHVKEDRQWFLSVTEKLPESIGQLSLLKYLEISDCEGIAELPATIGELSRLKKVVIRRCAKLQAWRPSSQHLQHVLELELRTIADPDEHLVGSEDFTITFQRQDLLAMAREGRSLLEAAVTLRDQATTEVIEERCIVGESSHRGVDEKWSVSQTDKRNSDLIPDARPHEKTGKTSSDLNQLMSEARPHEKTGEISSDLSKLMPDARPHHKTDETSRDLSKSMSEARPHRKTDKTYSDPSELRWNAISSQSSELFKFDENYVPLEDTVQKIHAAFEKSNVVVLYGDSGTGKSSVACHYTLCFKEAAMKKMHHGQSYSPVACYVYCGPEAVCADIQTQLLQAFNIQIPMRDWEEFGIREAQSQMHRLYTTLVNHLRDLEALVLLDDVWGAELLETVLVQGKSLKYLITCRNAVLWPDPNVESIKIQPIDMEDGRQILANYGQFEDHRIPGQFQVQADELIEATQSLPLALATLGTVLQEAGRYNADNWKNLRDQLLAYMESDRYTISHCGERYPRSVSAALMLMVDDSILAADAMNLLYIINLFQGPRISVSLVQFFLKFSQPTASKMTALKMLSVTMKNLEALSLVQVEKRPTEVLTVNLLGVVSTEALVDGAQKRKFQSSREFVINILRQSFILKQKKKGMDEVKGFLRGGKEFCSLTDRSDRSNDDWATVLCAISGVSDVRNEAQQRMGRFYKWWPSLLTGDSDLDSESAVSRRLSRILGNALDLLPVSIEELRFSDESSNCPATVCTEVLWTLLSCGKIDGDRISALLQEPTAMEWACSFLFDVFFSNLASIRQLSDTEAEIVRCTNSLIATLAAQDVTTTIQGKVLLILQWIVLSGTIELHRLGDREECLLDTLKLFHTLDVGGFLTKDVKHRCAKAAGLIAAMARIGCPACTKTIVETPACLNELVNLLAAEVATDLQEAALITLCEIADRDPDENANIFDALLEFTSALVLKVVPFLSQDPASRCQLSAKLIGHLSRAPSFAEAIVVSSSCLPKLIELLDEDVVVDLQEAALETLFHIVHHDADENASIFGELSMVASDLLLRIASFFSQDLGNRCKLSVGIFAYLVRAPSCAVTIINFQTCLHKLVDLLAEDVDANLQGAALYALANFADRDSLQMVTTDHQWPSIRDEIEKHISIVHNVSPSVRAVLYRYWYTENAKRKAYSDALDDLNKALALDSNDCGSWQERGILRRLMKDYHGALEDLDRALEIDSGDYECLKHRAFVKFLIGDEEGARANAEMAILFKPSSVDDDSYGRVEGCLGELSVEFMGYKLK